jgi:hypothetical protein
MVTNGHDATTCAPLVDWLRLALTVRNNNDPASVLAIPHPVMPQPTTLTDMSLLTRHRDEVTNRGLSNLRSTPLTQGAHHITRALGDLVNIQQRAINDKAQRRTTQANKLLSSSYFQCGLLKLMRWCHVGTEQNLPDVYTQLANSAKGQHRRVLQAALDEACKLLSYHYHNIQVTTSVARKIPLLLLHDPVGQGFWWTPWSSSETRSTDMPHQYACTLHAGMVGVPSKLPAV